MCNFVLLMEVFKELSVDLGVNNLLNKIFKIKVLVHNSFDNIFTITRNQKILTKQYVELFRN